MKKQSINDTAPGRMIQYYTNKFPGLWGLITKARSEMDTGEWPGWCHTPYIVITKVIGDIIGMENVRDLVDPDKRAEYADRIEALNFLVPTLCAIYNWSKTKNIYKFDKTISDELLNTKFDGNVPVKALLKLPDWCMFIEIPESPIKNCTEFFVLPDCSDKSGDDVLFLLPTCGNDKMVCAPLCIHLSDITIEESLKLGIELNRRLYNNNFYSHSEEAVIEHTKNLIAPMLHHVLYLCSEKPDIVNHNPHSTHKSPNKTSSYFPIQWDVGVRVGAAIRKVHPENSGATRTPHEGGHNRPRPHVRRAHWHHYWTGPRKEAQELIVKWLHPALVNASEEDALPAVIHEVEKG